jgi:hypothetical protein
MEYPSMNLMNIVKHTTVPYPLSEGEKIPWNERVLGASFGRRSFE